MEKIPVAHPGNRDFEGHSETVDTYNLQEEPNIPAP